MKIGIETRAGVGGAGVGGAGVGGGEIRVTDPKTGGQKGQKPERYDLFPFDALDEVARVYGVGAQKYADDNWLKGYRWRLSAGALLRHVSAFMRGIDRDEETGCLHLAHAAWHCLTLLTFYMRGLGTDDRAPPEPSYETPASQVPVVDEPAPARGKVTVVCGKAAIEIDGEPLLIDVDAPIPYVPTPQPAGPSGASSWAEYEARCQARHAAWDAWAARESGER